jgi:hypothetical protein
MQDVIEVQRHLRKPSRRRQKRLEFLDKGSRIDRASFILFPTVFLIFNIIYWGFYLTKSNS